MDLISSGIDCWLKKVEYPIIDKWYKGSFEGISYHEDHGEGLDDYHVGTSRGSGGLAIKSGDQYFMSKNFSSFKTIASGPLRTIFLLNYEDWEGPEGPVKEQKTISLDYGSNLTRIAVSLKEPIIFQLEFHFMTTMESLNPLKIILGSITNNLTRGLN